MKQKSPDVRLALGIFREQMMANIKSGVKAPHINLDLKKDRLSSQLPPTKDENESEEEEEEEAV